MTAARPAARPTTAAADAKASARQQRLLSFIDSSEAQVERLLDDALGTGADLAELVALLSDGSILEPYVRLVPRSEVKEQVAILRRQVAVPFLVDSWDRPTPGQLLAFVLFEGIQAVSEFRFSVLDVGSAEETDPGAGPALLA